MDNCLTKLDNDPQGYLSQPLTLLEAVLQECHNTFTACFHSFYPTPALQWACLCDLLNCLDQVIILVNSFKQYFHCLKLLVTLFKLFSVCKKLNYFGATEYMLLDRFRFLICYIISDIQ